MYINNYVFVLNDDGSRETSYGPDSYVYPKGEAQMLAEAKEKYPDKTCIWVENGDDMLTAFIDGKIYKDGKMVDPPVVEPSAIELKEAELAQLDADFKAGEDEYLDSIRKAILLNNTARQSEIQEEYQELSDSYKAELKRLQAELAELAELKGGINYGTKTR